VSRLRILAATVLVRVYAPDGRTFELLTLEPGQRLLVDSISYARDADTGEQYVVDGDEPGYWPEDLLYTPEAYAVECGVAAMEAA
jgi:hypothetical protein